MSPSHEHEHFSFEAGPADDGERLDRFLTGHLPEMSRSRVKTLIKDGHAAHDGRTIVEPNTRVKPGESYEIAIPPAEPAIPRGEDIPLNVVYEDDQLIVIDKPAGLVVHPAAGNWTGTLVNALIAHCGESLSGIGGVKRPGIVHRLDKQTSGLMVVAKTDVAHRALAKQFADHGRKGPMERQYTALAWGVPQRRKGTISAALGRKSENRQKMAVVKQGGKEAVTLYEVAETFGNGDDPIASLVVCTLRTGRTHQIRVHLAHIGHPLIGDATYGAGFRSKARLLGETARAAIENLNRQALHAHLLGFAHPATRETIRFESPLPEEISNLRKHLKEN